LPCENTQHIAALKIASAQMKKKTATSSWLHRTRISGGGRVKPPGGDARQVGSWEDTHERRKITNLVFTFSRTAAFWLSCGRCRSRTRGAAQTPARERFPMVIRCTGDPLPMLRGFLVTSKQTGETRTVTSNSRGRLRRPRAPARDLRGASYPGTAFKTLRLTT